MILSAAIMLVLALVLLAYVLEPILKADVDQVEIDSAVDSPDLPDFRMLLEVDRVAPEPPREEDGRVAQEPEPAENRS